MSYTATAMVSLLGLDPGAYRRHPLHSTDRAYPETNCYTDIFVELIHARGDEPLAMLGCALDVDFEGDQWTFFKPRPEDLARLHGIDVHEMQPYRPLPEQIAEQLGAGRAIAVELDAWYLPDTAATSYGKDHVKTSVIAEAIDREGERLRYFHNQGYWELAGADYRGAFRLGAEPPGEVLPPYTELVRFDAGLGLAGEELRAAARELLAGHVASRPAPNPFGRFGEQLGRDLPRLLGGDSAAYHDYAFATVRMVGSAFEVGASHVEWVLGEAGEPAAAAMTRIVDGSKALSFKLARRREFDPGPALEQLAAAWDESFSRLSDVLP
jgi:hypothetical protein